jgi:threonine/homoserine/homoserine lactone efflux protein
MMSVLMFEIDKWGPFAMTALSLILTPGPAKLLLLSTSASRGFKAGSRLASGIFLSDAIHVTLVAIGLGTLIISNETARRAIAVIGAFFLLYFAVVYLQKAVRGPPASLPTEQKEKVGELVKVGLLLNLFNPLAIAFYVGLLPQFASPQSTVPASIQLGIYGGALVSIFFTFHLLIAFAATLFKSRAISPLWFRVSFSLASAVLLWLCYRMLFGTFVG